MAYRNLLRNQKWFEFADKVKQRDGFVCSNCGKGGNGITLQVHHDSYVIGRMPWEYPVSACHTLCSGCHAREHGIIQPDSGWTLIEINDTGGLNSHCERQGCRQEIRYEHVAYHPAWGYMVAGSECINHLTIEDKMLCEDSLRIYKQAASFVDNHPLNRSQTKKGQSYLKCTYKHHVIRVYSESGNFAVQVAVKREGVKFYDYSDVKQVKVDNAEQAQELGYIWMRGMLSNDKKETEILRKMWVSLRKT
ncbi:MAG: hypothetical protein BWK73_38775 [Thiothrix lacustris]|jgi:hypothetical protein|uniref:HNH endonuclease n=1 Tax=Thiothrix lacustris TaxID=525917 RepID=A0A1Y1QER1_9GAMM|nr:MAG: hypothetical protein BWK73_38775 [Thiothrix lacustris]